MQKDFFKSLLESFCFVLGTCVFFNGSVFGKVPFFQELRLRNDKNAWSDAVGVKYVGLSGGSFVVGPFQTNEKSSFDEELEDARKKLPIWNASFSPLIEEYGKSLILMSDSLSGKSCELDRLRLLLDFSKEFGGAQDVERSLMICAQFVVRKFKLRNVLVSAHQREVRLFNVSETEKVAEQRLIAHVRGGKSACTVQNSQNDFLFEGIEGRENLPKVMAGFPVFSQGGVVGHVIVYSDEVPLLDVMTDVVREFGVICSRLANFERIQKVASEDSLTGLANRSLLQQGLDRVVPELQEKGLPFSVLIGDVDNFKKFNDTRGHPEGDRLLKSVADVMRSCAPKSSVCCRYGGEEFVMALPGLDQNAAKAVAESFRSEVEKVCGSTISIGVMTCANSSVSWQSCIREADRALYRAKHLGKNRVVSFLMLDKSLGVIDV